MDDDCDTSDPVFEDMAITDVAERRQFFDLCRRHFDREKNYGSNVVFGDFKVWFSLVIQIYRTDNRFRSRGLFDFDSASDSIISVAVGRTKRHRCGSLGMATDADGRIRKLSFHLERSQELPRGIHRLDRLEDLRIKGTRAISHLPLQELSSLPKLHRFHVHKNSAFMPPDRPCDLQTTERLPLVTTLSLRGSCYSHLLGSFPSVETLHVDFLRNQDIRDDHGDVDRIFDLLASCEMDKLQCLEFRYAFMNGQQLAKFMLEIAPRFPNLEQVKLFWCSCRTADFRVLANRLRHETTRAAPKSLPTFHLSFFLDSRHVPPDFKADMLTLLKFFATAETSFDNYQDEDEPIFPKFCSDPEWRYALIKNTVGRRMFKGGGDDRRGVIGLPPSAWPFVLHKAQQRICTGRASQYGLGEDESRASLAATGVYYLLRKGTALIGRRDLVGGPLRSPSKRQRLA